MFLKTGGLKTPEIKKWSYQFKFDPVALWSSERTASAYAIATQQGLYGWTQEQAALGGEIMGPTFAQRVNVVIITLTQLIVVDVEGGFLRKIPSFFRIRFSNSLLFSTGVQMKMCLQFLHRMS